MSILAIGSGSSTGGAGGGWAALGGAGLLNCEVLLDGIFQKSSRSLLPPAAFLFLSEEKTLPVVAGFWALLVPLRPIGELLFFD